jgi:hypothetical protein
VRRAISPQEYHKVPKVSVASMMLAFLGGCLGVCCFLTGCFLMGKSVVRVVTLQAQARWMKRTNKVKAAHASVLCFQREENVDMLQSLCCACGFE